MVPVTEMGRKEEEEREQGRNFRHSTLNLLNLRRLRHPSGICKEDQLKESSAWNWMSSSKERILREKSLGANFKVHPHLGVN